MTVYKLNEEKMFSDITDGVAIIINSETGIYYGMNEFGSNIFENIIKGVSIKCIIDSLKKISEVPSDIENKVNNFVNELIGKEIIIPSEKESDNLTINKEIAINNNFELEVSEYTDAQEMLLADPIHEIKEDIGWTPEKDSIGYTKEETKEREKKVE